MPRFEVSLMEIGDHWITVEAEDEDEAAVKARWLLQNMPFVYLFADPSYRFMTEGRGLTVESVDLVEDDSPADGAEGGTNAKR